MKAAAHRIRVLAFLALGLATAACTTLPTARMYEGPPRPPGEVAYISLASTPVSAPISVVGIDGESLADARKRTDRFPPQAPYVAVEPGLHAVLLQVPGKALRRVGPAVFPLPPIQSEREYSAGLVYDWYWVRSPHEVGVRYLWMAPNTDPTDHGGLTLRWSEKPHAVIRTQEALPLRPGVRPTCLRPTRSDRKVERAIRELRDRPR
jgi:hypothetical protein